MTAQPILETLAKEFSTDVSSIQATFEMLDAGLSAPFIGRFRRGQTGALSEVHVRRLARRREELVELDRRRGTILRALEREEGLDPKVLEDVRACMDRFELEDLYVPHRRPEPEVQLALDRGLGALADLLVAPVPKDQRAPEEPKAPEGASEAEAPDAASEPTPASEPESTHAESTDEGPSAEATEPHAPEPAPAPAESEAPAAVDEPPTLAHEARVEATSDAAPEATDSAAGEATPDAVSSGAVSSGAVSS
ncbi:MAG: Tex-like N-terminal domain-containing protein, partial [Planctomycetota bacterium]